MEGISITKLLVIAVLVILLFGTSKLRTLGADLGAALKGFKKAVGDDSTPPALATTLLKASPLSRASKRKTFNPAWWRAIKNGCLADIRFLAFPPSLA